MKACLLTVSEKFEWSKVSTNSFDSESSTSILVRDDVKRHTANTSKQIETLDAILAIQSLCLWFFGFVCVCMSLGDFYAV